MKITNVDTKFVEKAIHKTALKIYFNLYTKPVKFRMLKNQKHINTAYDYDMNGFLEKDFDNWKN